VAGFRGAAGCREAITRTEKGPAAPGALLLGMRYATNPLELWCYQFHSSCQRAGPEPVPRCKGSIEVPEHDLRAGTHRYAATKRPRRRRFSSGSVSGTRSRHGAVRERRHRTKLLTLFPGASRVSFRAPGNGRLRAGRGPTIPVRYARELVRGTSHSAQHQPYTRAAHVGGRKRLARGARWWYESRRGAGF